MASSPSNLQWKKKKNNWFEWRLGKKTTHKQAQREPPKYFSFCIWWINSRMRNTFKFYIWIPWLDVYLYQKLPFICESYPSSLLCPFIFWSSILVAGVVTWETLKIYFRWKERVLFNRSPGWKQRENNCLIYDILTYQNRRYICAEKLWCQPGMFLHNITTNLTRWSCQLSIICEAPCGQSDLSERL